MGGPGDRSTRFRARDASSPQLRWMGRWRRVNHFPGPKSQRAGEVSRLGAGHGLQETWGGSRDFVDAISKMRSDKKPRKNLRAVAVRMDTPVHLTIDNPAILDAVRPVPNPS